MTLREKKLMSLAIRASERAGKAILKVYARKFRTTLKKDLSPLTAADMSAHRVIEKTLLNGGPSFPILSEESTEASYRRRRTWQRFWMVDPLDGTREFVKRNGEFTVNIALIEGHEPVLGVVHAPVRHTTYFASKGSGAFKKGRGGQVRRIYGCARPHGPLKVLSSRSNRSIKTLLKGLGPFRCVKVGSSLKMCLIAEGRAHIYPRAIPSSEWDTAAGDCLIREAGGRVTDLKGRPLRYNKKSLLNPHFIATALKQRP